MIAIVGKKIGESSRVSRYICLIKIYQRACWYVKILRREDDDKWNVKKKPMHASGRPRFFWSSLYRYDNNFAYVIMRAVRCKFLSILVYSLKQNTKRKRV